MPQGELYIKIHSEDANVLASHRYKFVSADDVLGEISDDPSHVNHEAIEEPVPSGDDNTGSEELGGNEGSGGSPATQYLQVGFVQDNAGSWVDAFTEFGISFDSTALSALITPAPMKEMIENKSAIMNGKTVVRTNRKVDERTLTLGFNLTASSKADFLTKYGNFCSLVLYDGRLDIQTKYQPGVTYHLDYMSCQSFGEYSLGMAKFVLRAVESDPLNRI